MQENTDYEQMGRLSQEDLDDERDATVTAKPEEEQPLFYAPIDSARCHGPADYTVPAGLPPTLPTSSSPQPPAPFDPSIPLPSNAPREQIPGPPPLPFHLAPQYPPPHYAHCPVDRFACRGGPQNRHGSNCRPMRHASYERQTSHGHYPAYPHGVPHPHPPLPPAHYASPSHCHQASQSRRLSGYDMGGRSPPCPVPPGHHSNPNYGHVPQPHKGVPRPGGHKVHTDRKIFVGGLNYNTTDQELRDFFEERFGEVIEAHTVKNREGQSRGFGFVIFEHPESRLRAVQSNHLDCFGARVDIRAAMPPNHHYPPPPPSNMGYAYPPPGPPPHVPPYAYPAHSPDHGRLSSSRNPSLTRAGSHPDPRCHEDQYGNQARMGSNSRRTPAPINPQAPIFYPSVDYVPPMTRAPGLPAYPAPLPVNPASSGGAPQVLSRSGSRATGDVAVGASELDQGQAEGKTVSNMINGDVGTPLRSRILQVKDQEAVCEEFLFDD